MTKDDIDYLVKNTPENVVLVFDEAYYEYAIKNDKYPDSLEILRKRPNTIILRTFSKVAGIASVRVGYLLTSSEIASAMNKMKMVFHVNRLAQAAGIGALNDSDHIDKTVSLNYECMNMMEKYFEENNMEYIKSNSNFIFVNVGFDSKIVFEELLKKGIIVRPGYLWNWKDWLRVSTGTKEQIQKFIDALNEVLEENKKHA
jgi:histidinol-phosphate aminotransferase